MLNILSIIIRTFIILLQILFPFEYFLFHELSKVFVCKCQFDATSGNFFSNSLMTSQINSLMTEGKKIGKDN